MKSDVREGFSATSSRDAPDLRGVFQHGNHVEQIERLKQQCSGTISEIVPEAQSSSRTFQVKVTGPCPPGIYAGMFGRILVPLGEEDVLVIPIRAVQHVGQLKHVDVVQDERVARRSIRTGRTFAEDVEVLSGLRKGEQVVVPTSAPPSAGGGP